MIGSLAAAASTTAAAPSMMSLFGPAALLGGLGFGASLMSNSAQSSANSKALKWQRYNMQHAHQWEVEDLKKAGLNPILSAGGNGASAGSVPNAPLPGIRLGDMEAGLQVASAVQGIKESQARQKLIENQSTSEQGKPQNIVGQIVPKMVEDVKALPKESVSTFKTVKEAIDGKMNPMNEWLKSVMGDNSAVSLKDRMKHKPVLPKHSDPSIDAQLKLRQRLRNYDYQGSNYDTRDYWR